MINDYFSKYRVPIIVALLLLVANVLVFFFLAMPRLDVETANKNRLENITRRAGELNRALAKRQELVDRIKNNQEALEKFYGEILGTKAKSLTAILKEREDIGSKHGIVPTRVRYSNSPVMDMPLEEFSMTFPLSGSYQSLRFFIDDLETSSHFFIIDDVEMDGGDEASDELSMRIMVNTYFHGKRFSSGQLDREAENEIE